MKASVVLISKNEQTLEDTLAALDHVYASGNDVIVVDASARRLDYIRNLFPWVTWIDFEPVAGVRTSIPHQRNVGVRAAAHDVIVFTDAGCIPGPDWLDKLLLPIANGSESVTCGTAVSSSSDIYAGKFTGCGSDYLEECPTINLAFRREVYEDVGEFDETFQYGSDVDFSWRITAKGYRIKSCADAVVFHEWGTTKRQVKRAYVYGQARVRLYAKHPTRLRSLHRRDPIVLVYSIYVLFLPVAIIRPLYLGLLVFPLWRNRRTYPFLTTCDHLFYGLGVLEGIAALAQERLRPRDALLDQPPAEGATRADRALHTCRVAADHPRPPATL